MVVSKIMNWKNWSKTINEESGYAFEKEQGERGQMGGIERRMW